MLAQSLYDRFIPPYPQTNSTFIQPSDSCHYSPYQSCIKSNILPNSRLFNFNSKHNKQASQNQNLFSKSQFSQVSTEATQRQRNKTICPVPQKILDASYLRNDFYLNNVSWSENGPLAIGLENEVYLYNPKQIIQVCKVYDDNYVSSVKFQGDLLSIGFSDATVQIFDIEKCTVVRQINQHTNRVSVQQFDANNNLLLTGSKDKTILAHDLKMKNTLVNRLQGHRGEICALKKQPGQSCYLASGSNDNSVILWDYRQSYPLFKYQEHRGAVKGLNWCPWKRGLIGSGGGSGDRTIKIWTINKCEPETVCSIKTDSQVTGLLWNQQINSVISGHGGRKNQINVWSIENKYGIVSLEHKQQILGHRGRILGLQGFANKQQLCSYSADETIRFWNFVQKQDEEFQ